MHAKQFKNTAFSVLATMLIAFAIVLTALSSASAQERPRTIFDLLFGPKKAQPQQQYEQPKPQRARPAKPKRAPKATAAARSAPAPAPQPEVNFVEKKPDAKKVLVVGDFIGNGLAEGLDVAFAANPDLRIVSRINGSSGFVRDDHFDWPASISKILEEEARRCRRDDRFKRPTGDHRQRAKSCGPLARMDCGISKPRFQVHEGNHG
jgi:hypothetical protein